MSPVEAILVPFPPKTGTKLLHPRPPPQSLNGSYGEDKGSDVLEALRHPESRSLIREVAVKLLAPKCSSLHDAPRQPFAPNFQSTRVAMTA